jgi:hypothetical protein
MTSIDTRALTTRAATATTVSDYAAVWGDLEVTADTKSQRVKDEYRSSLDRIESARYRPNEERKQRAEAKDHATARLQELRSEYETGLGDLFTTAVRRAFPAPALIGADSENRRDAMLTAAQAQNPAEAAELLARAIRSNDDELVAAIGREAFDRGWWPVLSQIAAQGTPAQQRGAEVLGWVEEVRRHLRGPKAKWFNSARFGLPIG